MRWTVRARNTAVASTNKIHSDDVARRYGFAGGLVPGVDVYAYLTHVPAEHWAREWLERGTMRARFVQPIYDGEQVEVEGRAAGGALTLTARSPGGGRADGEAALPAEAPAPPDVDEVPLAPLPEERPPASDVSLAPGRILGTVDFALDEASAAAYLDDIGETLGLYRHAGLAHPGWLLRAANFVLTSNVVMGPWIHVASSVTHHGTASFGDDLSARARVTNRYERAGHRFVVLDVLIVADGHRPIARVEHTALYEPRQRDESASPSTPTSTEEQRSP